MAGACSSTHPTEPGTCRYRIWSGRPGAVSFLCVVTARDRRHALQIARQSFAGILTRTAYAVPETAADRLNLVAEMAGYIRNLPVTLTPSGELSDAGGQSASAPQKDVARPHSLQ